MKRSLQLDAATTHNEASLAGSSRWVLAFGGGSTVHIRATREFDNSTSFNVQTLQPLTKQALFLSKCSVVTSTHYKSNASLNHTFQRFIDVPFTIHDVNAFEIG